MTATVTRLDTARAQRQQLRTREQVIQDGFVELVRAYHNALSQAKRLRAKAAEMDSEIDNFIGCVAEREERMGPFDALVVEGWARIDDLLARQGTLLREAAALESVVYGPRGRER